MSETTLAARVDAPTEIPCPAHPDIAGWRTAGPDDIDAMHAVFTAAGREDHPTYVVPREEIADTFALAHIDHARDTILAFDADGVLRAVGSAFLHPARDEKAKVTLGGAVVPDWRRRGIGTAVLRWSFERGLQQLASIDSDVPGEIGLYAAERTADAATIAERLGLRTERWFTTMERESSTPPPVREAPPGGELIAYADELAEDVRAARNDAFRDHWGSLPTGPEAWRTFVGGPFLRPDLCTLLRVDGRVVAFCMASVHEEDFAALGASHAYIDLIGVVRDARGRGYAPTVVARTLAAIRAAGLERAVLDVDTASPTGALGLYERLGFTATVRDRALVRRF